MKVRPAILTAIRSLLAAERIPEPRIELALDVIRRGEASPGASLKPAEVAMRFKCSRRHVNRLINDGTLNLKPRRLGHRTVLYPAQDVEREARRLGV